MAIPSNLYRRFLPADPSLTTKAWTDISHRLGLASTNPGVFGITSTDGGASWTTGSSNQFLESIDPATGVLLAKTSKVLYSLAYLPFNYMIGISGRFETHVKVNEGS